MNQELVSFEVPEFANIEKSKAQQIKETFEPMAIMLSEFEKRYNKLMSIPLSDMTPEICKEYKRFRLDVSKVRINTGKAKDKAKEYLKLEDKAIMGVHNILVYSVKEMEDNAKKRENYYENLERERIEKLDSERRTELEKYSFAGSLLETNLGAMSEEVWSNYIAGVKLNYEKQIEAERVAEEKRIEQERIEKLYDERKDAILHLWQFTSEFEKTLNFGEQSESDYNNFVERLNNCKKAYDKEQEQIKAENERLKKEAKLKAKKEAAEKKKREAAEAELKAEKDRLQAELKAKEDARIEAQRKEKARLKAEEDARIQAEREAALAPDKDKILKIADQIEAIELPLLNEADSKKIVDGIQNLFQKTIKYINESIEKL